MNSKDVKMILKTALSLFLICAVSAGILGAVNLITEPLITANAAKAADEARAQVLPADSFEKMETADGKEYYKGTSDGTAGYVFTTSGSGYGGAVEVMTGIDTEGRVTGIKLLTINETPGLGMNAKKDKFLNQYPGQQGQLTVVKNKTPEDGEILAITSATITSKAVTSAVNEALALYEEVKEG